MAEPIATILNVNDHAAARYLVRTLLGHVGYRIIDAESGSEALILAAEHRPDMIVLDVKLPDMSGFEVCRLIKSDPTTSPTMVLMTSAMFTTTRERVEGLDVGADGYLAQPFDATELVAHVRSLLRLRTVEQQLRSRADELVLSAQRKDEFLAMLGHELRNPLAAMTMSIPLLETFRMDSVRHEQIRSVMQRQASHLARLVDDLLDVARVTQGKIELRKRPMDLRTALRAAVDSLQSKITQRRQTLIAPQQTQPMMALGDATRLEQIFANLLDNASKYSKEDTTITVSVAVEDAGDAQVAIFRVKDEGIGIRASFLPHVFEMFVQADESLDRARGGMGIGLTLVRGLIELHGGTITARSDGADRGSEFIVRLPLSRIASIPKAAPQLRRIISEPAKRRILLVEDNVDAREMMRSVIELSGHSVESAEDGPQAIRMIQNGDFELGVFDIGLPGMSGYELARNVRQLPHGLHMHLIALTGYGGDDSRPRVLGAGFDIHLVKPISPGALLDLLERLPAVRLSRDAVEAQTA